jgi:hypothetical protein
MHFDREKCIFNAIFSGVIQPRHSSGHRKISQHTEIFPKRFACE